MLTARYEVPDVIFTSELDVIFAVVSLHLEDPSRSFRELGRLAGCSHPHSAKIVRAWREYPEGIRRYLAEAGYQL